MRENRIVVPYTEFRAKQKRRGVDIQVPRMLALLQLKRERIISPRDDGGGNDAA